MRSKLRDDILGSSQRQVYFAAGLQEDLTCAMVPEEQLLEMEAMGGESTRIDPNTE